MVLGSSQDIAKSGGVGPEALIHPLHVGRARIHKQFLAISCTEAGLSQSEVLTGLDAKISTGRYGFKQRQAIQWFIIKWQLDREVYASTCRQGIMLMTITIALSGLFNSSSSLNSTLALCVLLKLLNNTRKNKLDLFHRPFTLSPVIHLERPIARANNLGLKAIATR